MGRMGFFLGLSIFSLMIACNKSEDKKVSQTVVCKDGVLTHAGIFGGKAVSKESVLAQGTVFVIFQNGSLDSKGREEMEMCTGSLVDRNIVLTAAHCVPASENASKVAIAFSVDPICQVHSEGEEALRPVEKVVKNPKYIEDSIGFSANDLAMIRFAGQAPSGKQTLKLLMKPVELNEQSTVILAGYGRTTDLDKDDPDGPILRTATINPVSDSKLPEQNTKSNKDPILFFDQSGGQGACAGDSGGPTLLQTDEGLFVIGVNSAVEGIVDGHTSCFKKLRSASVLAQKDWILATHKRIKNNESLGLAMEVAKEPELEVEPKK